MISLVLKDREAIVTMSHVSVEPSQVSHHIPHYFTPHTLHHSTAQHTAHYIAQQRSTQHTTLYHTTAQHHAVLYLVLGQNITILYDAILSYSTCN